MRNKSDEEAKNKIKKIAKLMEKDYSKPEKDRNFPSQALPALHDPRVQQVLMEQLSMGKEVTGVFQLGYEPSLEISYIYFSLSIDPIEISRTGLLCLIDKKCEVMGLKNDFVVPEKEQTVKLPMQRCSSCSPFVFTQPTEAAPTLTGAEQTIVGADLRNASEYVSPIGLTPYPNGPLVPQFPPQEWPPELGKVPIGDISNKNETHCQICKSVSTWIPGPGGGLILHIDGEHCTSQADDCGDAGLFNSSLKFGGKA